MEATIEALEAIREKGRAYIPEGTGEGYNLQLPVDAEILDGTVPVASSSTAVELAPVDAATPVDANAPSKIEEPKDNQILQCIDVIARVRFSFSFRQLNANFPRSSSKDSSRILLIARISSSWSRTISSWISSPFPARPLSCPEPPPSSRCALHSVSSARSSRPRSLLLC